MEYDVVRNHSGITSNGVTVNLASGVATDEAGNTDTLLNIEGVRGSNFADSLTGGNAASDAFEFFAGNGGDDTIDGGTGFDRVDYVTSTLGVTVTLGGSGSGTAQDGLGGIDTLISIEAVRGSAFDDALTGSDDSSIFEAFSGREGDDLIDGGGGVDRVDYQQSRQASRSAWGWPAPTVQRRTATVPSDTLRDIEDVRGTRDFDDLITGNELDNTIAGLGGNDTLSGGSGNDILLGGDGNDTFLYAGTATITGGTGVDVTELSPTAVSGGNAAILVTDFQVGAGGDKLDLGALIAHLQSLGMSGSDPFASGWARLLTRRVNTEVQVDFSGAGNGVQWVNLATLQGVAAGSLTSENFVQSVVPVVGTDNVPPELLLGGSESFIGDGRVITDFNGGDDVATGVAVLADGRFVVSGSGGDGIALARYNADGSLDATFGLDGKVSIGGAAFAQAMALQPDGKLLIAGYAGADFALLRFNSDGNLDTTFGGGAGQVVTDFGAGSLDLGTFVAVQGDGKIVVAGYANSGSVYDFALARYDADGSLDTSFGGDGKVTTDFGTNTIDLAWSVTVQADGKIVAAGQSGNAGGSYDIAVIRYNPDGSLDTTFGNGDGKVISTFPGSNQDRAYSILVQPDGKIVVAGAAFGVDFALARYDADGSLDGTFGVGGLVLTDFAGNQDAGLSVVCQPDGRLLVAGLTNDGSGGDFAVARYNADGSLDTSFGVGGKVTVDTNGNYATIALRPDGGIVVAGSEAGPVGDYDFSLALLRPDGRLDSSFSVGSVTEDSGSPLLGTSGSINFDDPNDTDTHTITVSAAATNVLGGNLIAEISTPATGPGAGVFDWSYSLDNAASQSLGAGEHATESFDVTVNDGRGGLITQTLSVSVNGVNDAPLAIDDALGSPDLDLVSIAFGSGLNVYANDGGGTFTDTGWRLAIPERALAGRWRSRWRWRCRCHRGNAFGSADEGLSERRIRESCRHGPVVGGQFNAEDRLG